MVQTIGSLITQTNMLINSHIHLEKFVEVDNDKLVVPENYYVIKTNQEEALRISNLNFRYFNSEENIFTDLNLSVPKNQHIVLTGPNGSGKSTLLGLIAKVFYPQSGTIQANTDKIGYVGVTPLIFNDSIKNNILYGNDFDVGDEEIVSMINEFDLFHQKNFSLQDNVSNKSLSSGQMQKIAFIRALLNKNELLLLDESTSNLDIETKNLIFNILRKRILQFLTQPTTMKILNMKLI